MGVETPQLLLELGRTSPRFHSSCTGQLHTHTHAYTRMCRHAQTGTWACTRTCTPQVHLPHGATADRRPLSPQLTLHTASSLRLGTRPRQEEQAALTLTLPGVAQVAGDQETHNRLCSRWSS